MGTMAARPTVRGMAGLMAVAVAVLVSGCSSGGTGDSTSAALEADAADVAGVHGPARLTRLAALAQKEGGELSLYTSSNDDVVSDIVDDFENRFDIDVAIYRARSETLLTRLEEEHRAGFAGADVVNTNGVEMILLHDDGALAPWTVDDTGLLPGSEHDGWVASSFQRFVAAWHKGTRPPTSWEDFADPRFKGKIGVEAGDFDWYTTLRQYWIDHGKTPAEADRLFAKIAHNAKVVAGHSLMLALIASGELDAGTSNIEHLVERKRAEGAPVAWKPVVEPTFLAPDGLGIGAEAPHPATAALFLEWALTREGQQAFVNEGYVSVRRDLQHSPDVDAVPIDVEKVAANEESLRAAWEKVTRGGTPASD